MSSRVRIAIDPAWPASRSSAARGSPVDLIVGLLGQGWSEGTSRETHSWSHARRHRRLPPVRERTPSPRRFYPLTDDSFGPRGLWRADASTSMADRASAAAPLPEAGTPAAGRVSGESALREGLWRISRTQASSPARACRRQRCPRSRARCTRQAADGRGRYDGRVIGTPARHLGGEEAIGGPCRREGQISHACGGVPFLPPSTITT